MACVPLLARRISGAVLKMAVPFWIGHYIGIPFAEHGRAAEDGLDCWGLYRLVMAEQFSVALPSFHGSYAHAQDAVGAALLIEKESKRWLPVDAGQENAGDAVILRLRGNPMHVGMVAGDGLMLHTEEGTDSTLESYTGPRWKNRVVAFYRHHEMHARNNGP